MQLDFTKDVVMPALLIMIVYVSWAQSNIEWNEHSPEVKQKRALLTDAVKSKNYKAALEPLVWLLDSVPRLSKSIYIHGDVIFKELARREKEEGKKRFYQERRLALFDQRLLYFTDKINVLNRKAYASYLYFKNRPEKYAELYLLFKQVMSFEPEQILKANIAAYPYVLGLYKAKGGVVADKLVLEHYDKITLIVENRQLDESIQRSADNMLADGLELNCSIIQSRFGEPFLADPDDINKAEKIVRLGLAYDCKTLPVFLEAAKAVHEVRPNGKLAYLIATRSRYNDKIAEAIFYYREALKLIDNDHRKSEIYYALATIFQRENSKSDARKAALNAIAYDPLSKKSYRLIGDLYWTSVEECQEKKSKTKDRAVYLAAFDMYQKADDVAMMESARQQFPSGEEIFWDELEVGQKVEVGCWIDEEVVLRKR